MSNTPSDEELDALIAEYRTRIYPQDMQPRFERAIMRAAIAKWGTPQPVEREPLTDEQRNAIFDKHCFLGDNGWEVNWWQVIDEVEAAHGIKGGQHGAE